MKYKNNIIFLLLIIIISLNCIKNCQARDYYVIGPAVGWINGKPDDPNKLVASFDITYAHIRKERESNFHFFDKILWVSSGFKYYNTDEKAYLPYLEAGLWFFLNIGVGYSYGFSDENYKKHNINLFFGMPLPAFLLKIKLPVFIEPYYRPIYSFENKKKTHEFGIIAKKGFF